MSRTRLSAKYSLWMKFLLTLALFILLFATDVAGTILRFLPDLGDIGEALIKLPLFIFLCYKLIDFIFKERKVAEFDHEYLYITIKKENLEYQIPLEKVLKLNRRPGSFSIGAYNFSKYNLHFINDNGTTEKQSFFIRSGWDELFQFIKLVKTKNPDFISKTWTHSFDFVDKYP
jgi:hypothetical protein